MENRIGDKEFLKLSQHAYAKKPLEEINIVLKNGTQKWTLEKIKGVKTHDKQTGFDAVVYKKGNNVVIAFRGTQGDDLLGEGFADLKTDIKYIANQNADVKQVVPKKLRYYFSDSEITKGGYIKNQFTQADALVKKVKEKYPNAHIASTGHSLGGGQASYAGAIHSVEAVTFSSPTVLHLLPEKLQKKVNKGHYDQTIVNFIHPRDSIGAGGIAPYKRHIGSSYYIGLDYELENSEWLDKPLKRLYFSLAKDNYHNMKHFEFDKFGNINNPNLTNALTGDALWKSPRHFSTGGTSVDVTPLDLLDVAADFKQLESRVDSAFDEAKSYINRLNDIQKNGHLQDEVLRSIKDFQSWFTETTHELYKNLETASDSYVRADELP
ncbi:hypothetical protein [Bacillus sp. CECT 9360]|uniref:lipase family protein n=1 Tax=Bacillus sp. CECT 9360 TaxID=2845821 RepID=UPI001E4E34C2|nr:hypothetical protein [Bacillus sp. CECT 9360]CAH0343891.1 hypothetical protein BCI9360_00118 [Bacillus sp. CECT 9360]